jgi:hypothetical protein
MSDYLLHQASGEFSISNTTPIPIILTDDSSAAPSAMSDNSQRGTKEKLKGHHIPGM